MFKHCVIVFFVSMVPLIELRGAIPYGVAFGSAPVADVSDRHRGQYAAGSHHLFFCTKSACMGGKIRGISENFSPFAWKKGGESRA